MILTILSIIALCIMYINLQLAHENAPFFMRLVILCLQCLMLCLVILCLSSYVSLTRQAYMPHDVRLSRLCGRTYLLQKRKRKSWTASGDLQSKVDGRI
jgi:hypothetical protein